MRKFILILLIAVLSVWFFGCSQNVVKEDATSKKTETSAAPQSQPQQKENTPANPHGDGSMQPKQPKPIVVPDEVAKKFKAVNLSVISLKDNKTIPVKAIIGQETKVQNTPITIYVEAYLPDFTMGTENITSASAEEKNPAVKVIITKDQNKYEGWIFKNFEIHKIEDPDYEFKLLGGAAK